MQKEQQDYSLFFKFIEAYSPEGFSTIKESDSLILDLEEQMAMSNQFIYFADVLNFKILYTSKRSIDIIGVPPNELSPVTFVNITHPNDISRLFRGREKLVKISQELLVAQKGHILFSTNFRLKKNDENYTSIFQQAYFFYCPINKRVYLLKIHTDINKNKNGFHYYLGDNLSYFKYPDEDLLNMGNNFSTREFEIIKLIEKGLSTKEIAEKLFISPYTVNTHRRNIIAKTDKSKIADIISDLFEMGFL